MFDKASASRQKAAMAVLVVVALAQWFNFAMTLVRNSRQEQRCRVQGPLKEAASGSRNIIFDQSTRQSTKAEKGNVRH